LSAPKQEKPYSPSLAFLLNNSIKRWIQPPSKLLDMLEIRPTDTVVDFGCGPGFYTLAIARRARSAVAVDISPEMLKKVQGAAEKAGVTNIQFMESDGRKLQLGDGSADKVLLVRVYHEVHEQEAVLREFGRVLRPEGRLILVERVRKSLLPGPPAQDPDALKKEVEGSGLFRLQNTLPLGNISVLVFGKNG
jgi:ubiquinone/menaquinone biosynthesis C-methylase UbiE